MASLTAGIYALVTDDMDLESLLYGIVSSRSSSQLTINLDGEVITFRGFGFTYDVATGAPTGGTVTSVHDAYLGSTLYDLSGISVPATTVLAWAVAGDNIGALTSVLAGADNITGSALNDLLRGYGGNDLIGGGGGNDSLDGGAGDDNVSGGLGNDRIIDVSGSNYLRGDDGDDVITGGSGFDDMNGNAGNDTVRGSAGDDWAVGGKDNDSLFGDTGGDVVWGNLGNDTQDGGDGNDQVRGGQGDDTITGGAGNDYVSGDRGNDTIAGGTGADLFHGSQDAGIDRVVDFRLSEGDRVMLDPGTTYTLRQVGADTAIDMGGGHQMILVGVQLSTLTGGWIFSA